MRSFRAKEVSGSGEMHIGHFGSACRGRTIVNGVNVISGG